MALPRICLRYEHPWESPERVMTRDEANEGRDLALRLQAEFDRVTPGYEIQDDLPFIIENPRAQNQFYETHVQRTRLCLQDCLCFHIFYNPLEVNAVMLWPRCDDGYIPCSTS